MAFEISVIVPTFNRAGLIGATLESILRQTHRPAEVIVVDDGSTDNTAEVVRQYPGVRYHRTVNSGVCRARNVGAALARGAWLAFCDSDDLWREDRLRSQVELLRQAPGVEYCFTNFVTVTADRWAAVTKFEQAPADFWQGLPLRGEGPDGFVVDAPLYPRILRFQPIFQSTLLMTCDFFRRVGGYDEAFGRVIAEDLEFTLRCVQEQPAAVVTRPVVGVRKHAANFSGNLLRTLLGEVSILEYARRHHPAGRECQAWITEEIELRRIAALETAFAAGDLVLVRQLAATIPQDRYDAKLKLKCLTARLPEQLGHGLARLLCGARQVFRTGEV